MKNVTDFKAKVLEKVSKDEAEKAVKIILKYIGETPSREGLVDTPSKGSRSLLKKTSNTGEINDADC